MHLRVRYPAGILNDTLKKGSVVNFANTSENLVNSWHFAVGDPNPNDYNRELMHDLIFLICINLKVVPLL